MTGKRRTEDCRKVQARQTRPVAGKVQMAEVHMALIRSSVV